MGSHMIIEIRGNGPVRRVAAAVGATFEIFHRPTDPRQHVLSRAGPSF
jgi:hypothetical protein